jgi:hypothetical protein
MIRVDNQLLWARAQARRRVLELLRRPHKIDTGKSRDESPGVTFLKIKMKNQQWELGGPSFETHCSFVFRSRRR